MNLARLPDSTRRKLEGLALVARSLRVGAQKGERRSVKRGTSLEFADYRAYSAGDDLRQLDWNVYARLERPVVKLREDEEDLAVHVLIDSSASMALEPDAATPSKLEAALRLSAALGYISLGTGDRLAVHSLNSPVPHFVGRGRRQMVAFLKALDGVATGGTSDLNASLRAFALRERRRGMLWLLTDAFSSAGYAEGLSALRAKGHEVVFVHILAPQDMQPSHTGDLRLVDSETGEGRDLTLDNALLSAYERHLKAWQDELRAECARRDIAYALFNAQHLAEAFLLGDARRLGLLR